MHILQADLYVPGWCSFRVPHGTNVHPTFSVPPLSTLYGLLANAMGLAQDDFSYRDQMQLGVQIIKRGEQIETYTQWMKWNPHKNQYRMLVTKQKLLFPVYRMYVHADNEVLNRVADKLKHPERILYLGESDDIVEITNIEIKEWLKDESTFIHSIIPVSNVNGQLPTNEFEQIYMPVKFEQSGRDQYQAIQKMFYVNEMLEFSTPIPCVKNDREESIILEGYPC